MRRNYATAKPELRRVMRIHVRETIGVTLKSSDNLARDLSYRRRFSRAARRVHARVRLQRGALDAGRGLARASARRRARGHRPGTAADARADGAADAAGPRSGGGPAP